jgi:anti-sigma factor RsiW
MLRNEMKLDTLDDRINAYLDGELAQPSVENLLREADSNPAVRAELDRAKSLRWTLRSLDDSIAPPDLAESVLGEARRTSHQIERPPVARAARGRRLVSSLAAAAMIVIAILLVVPGPAPDPAETYTEQEVAQALEDIYTAFAIVSQVGERTGRIVRDEALMGRTIEPVRNALKGVVGPQDTQL